VGKKGKKIKIKVEQNNKFVGRAPILPSKEFGSKKDYNRKKEKKVEDE